MKGKITISRNNHNMIRIAVEDAQSGIQFVEMYVTPERFALAVTGYALQEGDMEVRGLEHVGKERVTERREIFCPVNTYDRNEYRKWLIENAQEPGWIVDSYLGSQGSIVNRDDGAILRYNVTKYIDAEGAK